MIREKTYLGLQKLLLLLCVGLTLLFLFIFVPLHSHNKNLQNKVESLFNQLVLINKTSEYKIGFDKLTVETNLHAIQPRIRMLRNTYLRQIKMLELPQEILKRYLDPFQTFEYILVRNELSAKLSALAQEKKVTLDPSVLNSLPEYDYGMTNSQFLWIKLQTCQRILESAISVAPASIDIFNVLAEKTPFTEDAISTNYANIKNSGVKKSIFQNTKDHFIEIPVSIKLTGSTESVLSFLRDFEGSLPQSMEPQLLIDNKSQANTTQDTAESKSDDTENIIENTETNLVQSEESADISKVPDAEQPATPEEKTEEKTPETTPSPSDTPTTPETSVQPSAEQSSENPTEEIPEIPFKNSIFLGPFELYIAPTNPDFVTLNAIVSCIYRIPEETK